LVTGAGGFIGSHLVESLVGLGASVRAFVRYNSRGDPGLLTQLPPRALERVEIFAGDLRDLAAVQAAMRDRTHVFHLGALIAIPYSYIHPAEVVETNVIGTLNVLLASRQAQVARLIHHVDQRGLWYRPAGSDRRNPSLARSIPLFGKQDRRRQNR